MTTDPSVSGCGKSPNFCKTGKDEETVFEHNMNMNKALHYWYQQIILFLQKQS